MAAKKTKAAQVKAKPRAVARSTGTKTSPVRKPAPVRVAAPVINVGGELAVVIDEAPAQVGRADRHPRTRRLRG